MYSLLVNQKSLHVLGQDSLYLNTLIVQW